ncbi:solanesyl diphosphate synthase [Romeria aff. gracilis LEGE 07310]|uniref:Solanesyl diphosphate synthase n=1 Tax=Vasconcelosia minhoensis LEGE 07310 TaxID=915328 RepID=A0A8J7DLX9_9CYAN|nr:solanesyl diphosphate synthase [Romeria gracilis]MBE9077931.1 solanesyl diphosphate synthase [Romeria aff. gracilis LEGE 07310]
MTSVTTLFSPVEADLCLLADNLKELVGARHKLLYAAAEHLFGAGGKRIRPAIVLLLARATTPDHKISPKHRRLAEITEMIHTASLVHDDVVDESALRRGVPTVHSSFGNRVAILAGDFLFAQSSWYLANLDNLAVVKLLSRVIMDLAEGEMQQGLSRFDPELSFDAYLEKSYYKTASLIANSSKSVGVLSDTAPALTEQLYSYGRSLGLAFQIVDDILDFTGSEEMLGKPVGSDLRSGNLTAPVLYAMEEFSGLAALIEREFSQSGDFEQAVDWVQSSQGIARSRQLAKQYTQQAIESLAGLKPSESRQSLEDISEYNLRRLH